MNNKQMKLYEAVSMNVSTNSKLMLDELIKSFYDEIDDLRSRIMFLECEDMFEGDINE